jgi:gamma-glutamyl-gamma-aminobutyrate hydrolase PuuD
MFDFITQFTAPVLALCGGVLFLALCFVTSLIDAK